MSEKSELLVNELVSACIAFRRGQLPDWQTRIEDARHELQDVRWLKKQKRCRNERVTEAISRCAKTL